MNKKLIPAPLYYWKVVHDPTAKQATAIIGINNVWFDPNPLVFCTDVCQQITWIDTVIKSRKRH